MTTDRSSDTAVEPTAEERFLHAKRRLAVAGRELDRLGWLPFRRRRELEAAMQVHAAAARALAPQVADDALMRAFWRERTNDTRRNPAHPEVLHTLPQHSDRAAAAARDSTHHSWPGAVSVRWSEHPDVLQLMTPARAAARIRELVDDSAATMADPTFLYWRHRSEHDRPAVIVQHRASGLRARFWETDWDPTQGRIYSKPYHIVSIDPADEHPETLGNWERYAGLGIGKRLYLVGASLLPQLRWGSSSTQSGAIGARIALHAADPYRWSTPTCDWCNERRVARTQPYWSWDDQSEDDFTTHPRTQLAVPQPTLINVTPTNRR